MIDESFDEWLIITWVFNPCRDLIGKQSCGLMLAVKCKKTSMVSCCVKIPVCATLLANSSKVIAGSLIKYKADPKMITNNTIFWYCSKNWFS